MEQRDWEGEWGEIVRAKNEAIEGCRRLQAEVLACLRRREPPMMQLLRAADRAADELGLVKAREEAFLRDWRKVRIQP